MLLHPDQALLDLAPYKDQQLALLLAPAPPPHPTPHSHPHHHHHQHAPPPMPASPMADGAGGPEGGREGGGAGGGAGGACLVLLPPPALRPVEGWRSCGSVLQVGVGALHALLLLVMMVVCPGCSVVSPKLQCALARAGRRGQSERGITAPLVHP